MSRPKADRPIIVARLAEHAGGRTVIVLKSPREIGAWLATLQEGRGEISVVKSR